MPGYWLNLDITESVQSECRECAPGTVSTADGSRFCVTCRNNEFASFDGTLCIPCPASEGILCEDGILKPQPGYWIPADLISADQLSHNTTSFDSKTPIYKCLRERSCLVATQGLAYAVAAASGNTILRDQLPPLSTPATAYECAKGHTGVLCAACNHTAGYYFAGNKCEQCEEQTMSDAKWYIAVIGVSLLLMILLTLYVKNNATRILDMLKQMKRGDRMYKKTYNTRKTAIQLSQNISKKKKNVRITMMQVKIVVRSGARSVLRDFVMSVKNGRYGIGETGIYHKRLAPTSFLKPILSF